VAPFYAATWPTFTLRLTDDQANLAMAAFSELVQQEDALRDIEALLAATYDGVPS